MLTLYNITPGHLAVKGNTYYTVLEFKDENGKRKSKWETTGLPVKGNKKKAEEILLERRKEAMALANQSFC